MSDEEIALKLTEIWISNYNARGLNRGAENIVANYKYNLNEIKKK